VRVTHGLARLSWEVAQVLGCLALLSCLLLYWYAVRARRGSARTVSLARHEQLGTLALAAAVMHVVILLAADGVVVEHLKPGLPVYELAGILALLMLAVLALPAREALRRKVWARHRDFQAWHLGLSCLLLPAIAAHVIGTDRYVHGQLPAAGIAVACATALVALLRARASAGVRATWPFGRYSDMAFGALSRSMAALVALCLALLLALPWRGVAAGLRESPLSRTQALVVTFPHEKHASVACVTCHHEFLDRSGSGTCYSCHRSDRADLPRGAEALFHVFCLGCHRDPPSAGGRHGPVTGCASCHAARLDPR
jgi:predicted CXXCH cytochrome family protein